MKQVNDPRAAIDEFGEKFDADDGFSDLIAEFGHADPVIEVSVNGKIYTFQALVNRTKFLDLMKRAKAFVEIKNAPNAKVNGYLQMDPETKVWSFILAEISIKPKLTRNRMLKLADEAFRAWDLIRDGYMKKLANIQDESENKELETRGEGSSGIQDGETA